MHSNQELGGGDCVDLQIESSVSLHVSVRLSTYFGDWFTLDCLRNGLLSTSRHADGRKFTFAISVVVGGGGPERKFRLSSADIASVA